MEWSIGDDEKRYTTDMVDVGGNLEMTFLKSDEEIISIPNISISRDSKSDRLWINIMGKSQLAHVVKVKDSWWIHLNGRIHVVKSHEIGSAKSKHNEGSLVAPMPGTIIEILVKEGQKVRQGQTLMVMEAMKMEHKIQSPKDGEVSLISNKVGQRVDMGAILVEITE
ncbi:MAG: acetyl-CoA carboxylase biotin carboxyl carrier protein subunit [Candidatus Poseidoniales archaeon]|jgi:acetyl/propionyl-CoA carboxylase alpha subunit|tara:strand:- start:4701 stop:5201 length:501 start_codon:yes stop_codon:yes gene_type:complete